MKIAFLSDIHGNYEALKAVFLELKKKKISKVVCLGDYLNYYYEPKKCLDLLIKKKAICIKGNHEEIFLETLKNKKKIKLYAERYGNSIYINLKQLNQILGLNFKRILFDNMSKKQLRKCLKICKNKYETEYSGNADLNNIKKISNTGINRISVGAITHSAKTFDASLLFS